jgi:hypothetical protein
MMIGALPLAAACDKVAIKQRAARATWKSGA